MPPPNDGKGPLEPKKEIDISKILLPKKETGPNPESAQRVNAGALLAQEENATLLPPVAPVAPAAPTTPAAPVPEESSVRPLQTYKGDVEKIVHDGPGVSVVSIAAAEADRRSKQPLSTATPAETKARYYSWFMIAGGALLVFLAAAAIGFVILRPTSVSIPEQPQAPFLFIDESMLVPVDAGTPSRNNIMKSLQAARVGVKLPLGLIEWIYVAEPGTATTSPRQLGIQELLGVLAPQMPPDMLRTLENQYLLGIHSFDENQPFLLLQIDSYEIAYAGMLQWERTLENDLSPLFDRTPSPRANTEAPSASSTTQFLPTNFIDKVVENRDVRLIQNEKGDILLLWTFLGRNTLLITTNEYTLREVLSRLKAAPVIPIPGQ